MRKNWGNVYLAHPGVRGWLQPWLWQHAASDCWIFSLSSHFFPSPSKTKVPRQNDGHDGSYLRPWLQVMLHFKVFFFKFLYSSLVCILSYLIKCILPGPSPIKMKTKNKNKKKTKTKQAWCFAWMTINPEIQIKYHFNLLNNLDV